MNTILTQLTNTFLMNRTQLLLLFPFALHFINVHYVPEIYKKPLYGYTFGGLSMIICNYIDFCIKDT